MGEAVAAGVWRSPVFWLRNLGFRGTGAAPLQVVRQSSQAYPTSYQARRPIGYSTAFQESGGT